MNQQHCQQSEPPKPSELKQMWPKPSVWCEQMARNAKDGDEAYAYFQLKRMWEQREKSAQAN